MNTTADNDESVPGQEAKALPVLRPATRPVAPLLDGVTHGDCLDVMKDMPSGSIDFILTDPPYLVRYRDRSGRSVKNDDNAAWLEPAFAEMHRVLKDGRFCVSFYAWNKVDLFMQAWRKAGFSVVGHIVFTKKYASSERYMRYQHEQAYLLCKGRAVAPACPPPDVISWTYTGNRLHPTQKPVGIFRPLIEAFTKPGDTVLDPFCGSGSTLVAARDLDRHFIGVELDPAHHRTASLRLRADPGAESALSVSSNFNRVAQEPIGSKFHKMPDAPVAAPAGVPIKQSAPRVHKPLGVHPRTLRF